MNLQDNQSAPKQPEETKKTAPNWFWPDVSTPESAKSATKQGIWAAIFIAASTAILSAIALSTNPNGINVGGLTVSALSFIDSAIFAAVAFGLHKENRFAAIAGLLIFGLNKVQQYATMSSLGGYDGGSLFITIAIAGGLISGIRGTQALHRMKKTYPA